MSIVTTKNMRIRDRVREGTVLESVVDLHSSVNDLAENSYFYIPEIIQGGLFYGSCNDLIPRLRFIKQLLLYPCSLLQ